MSTDNIKLIYVLKVGKNSKGESLYEFIFSKDPGNIDVEMWNWDQSPAIEHKEFTIPDSDYVDEVLSLTTKDFSLFCLHDAVDRPYIHGYHLIQALAYEDEEDDSNPEYEEYEEMFESNDELPLLVFHYGMTKKQVEDKLYERNIILKENSFINTSAITKK